MEVIKKLTAVQIRENKVNDVVRARLEFAEKGEQNCDYWSDYFDYSAEHGTEAIKYAFKENKTANWLILPIIKFKYE